MIKKISSALFIVVLFCSSIFALNIYRQIVPVKYFFLFLAFLGMFIIVDLICYKVIKERFADNPYALKIFSLLSSIVFGLLFYLYAIFIYPGSQ